ncbi:hypothetical protein ABEX78_32395 [Priestia megaterium]
MASFYRELSNGELEATIEECEEFIRVNPHLIGGCHAMRDTIKECKTILLSRETGEPLPDEPGVDYYIERAKKRLEQTIKEIEFDDRLRAAGKKPYLADGFIRNKWLRALENQKQDLLWLLEQKEDEEGDKLVQRELELEEAVQAYKETNEEEKLKVYSLIDKANAIEKEDLDPYKKNR